MRRLIASTVLAVATPAAAGPPFVTDDPVPTDFRRWEIYGYGEGLLRRHGAESEVGVDLNYGALRDVQLTATLPYAARADGVNRLALGDVELGAKYRIVHQHDGSALPDISVFPRLSVPTAGRRGAGRVGAQLPVWAGKDSGGWSLFGGGGYAINPGGGRRSYWFTGVTLARKIAERTSLGVEVFHQGRDAADGTPSTLVGLGATRAIAARWSVLAAGGAFTAHTDEHGRYRLYLALLFHD